jgi:Domain of unknown function (DUF4450)
MGEGDSFTRLLFQSPQDFPMPTLASLSRRTGLRRAEAASAAQAGEGQGEGGSMVSFLHVKTSFTLVGTLCSRLFFNVTQVSSRCRYLLALFALALRLPAAENVPAAPPEWIQVHAPNLESNTARSLRYWPDGTDFVITNGTEFFNRPLYCANTAFRVDGGDKPEFSFYVPGRGGNLRFGIKTPTGTKWLNDAGKIVMRYRSGSLVYEIHDSLLANFNRTLHLSVLPLPDVRGIVVRAELTNAVGLPIDLIWAFGGANGMRGSRAGDIGCEREPVSQFFQLRPDQCRSNEFSIVSDGFTLRSRTVTIAGVASTGATHVVADANQWSDPTRLLASAGAGRDLPVVAGRISLEGGRPIFLVLQAIDENSPRPGADQLPGMFAAAMDRCREVAQRVVVETPDPFINAAAAAINVGGDGIWDEAQGAYMHGAVAWRSKLLGWRGPYTGDALGWHERARRHLTYWGGRQNTNPIPPNFPQGDANVNLARNEAALHSYGDMSNSHYDMNLVYIDALFRHLLWTGDVEFARQQWPVIERHLGWERRLFRREFGPEKLPLYEAYAAIWASDDLQYHGGGAAHSTAYNYYHNRMAARIAKLIGKDPTLYEQEADLIAKGMRQNLWLADRGWFAEFKDYLGLQLVHPNAGLWTFYHTVDSEVPTPIEAWQMTRFVDTQIAHIPISIPRSRREEAHSEIRNPKSEIRNAESLLTSAATNELYYTLPTTSWMPYLWSINNVVMAEVAHTSLAYWQANRPDAAFTLFKGCLLDSMYMGLCPGNVGMTTYFDMARREAQRDFGDAVGICSRTMVEGLFGIHPDALAGEIRIQPGFPADWNHAKMHHPDFNFAFQRDGLKETYVVEPAFPKPMRIRLQVPALRAEITAVSVNGRPGKWRAIEDSVGRPRIEIETEPGLHSEVTITWSGAKPLTEIPVRVVTDVGVRGIAAGDPVHRTEFAKMEQGSLKWRMPQIVEIRPPFEIISDPVQDDRTLRFRLRNNTSEAVARECVVRVRGETQRSVINAPAQSVSGEIRLRWGAPDLFPGSVPVTVELGEGKSASGTISNWKHPGLSREWKDGPELGRTGFQARAVNLEPLFNDKVTQIFRNEYLSPRSTFCSLAQPKQGIGGWCDPNMTAEIDDSGLRRAAAENGGKILVQGVPFQTLSERDAKNIAFTSQWDNYPRELSTPLDGKAAHVYLLMAGSSNPMQSRFDNGEVIVTYADGSTERLALQNPVNWWPIDQDYFIDDFAFRRPEPIPPRVDLKTGTVRLLDVNSFKGQGGKIPGGAATVLDLPLDPAKELKSLTVRTLANEVVIGLMAATLAQ